MGYTEVKWYETLSLFSMSFTHIHYPGSLYESCISYSYHITFRYTYFHQQPHQIYTGRHSSFHTH
jgi:hypothetical protein